MKTLALVVAVAVGLTSSSAGAEPAAPTQRGALTGLGLGFLLAGLTGVGFGVAGVVNASNAAASRETYGTPTMDQAVAVSLLNKQFDSGSVMAGVGFALGGALFIASIICFIVDRPSPVAVTFVPTLQGGTFALSATF